MELQVFNGGLSTRLAPHLIKPNEARVYENIDNSSGTLKSVYDKAEDGITLEQYSHFFESEATWVESATYRQYLEYQSNLYYAEASEVPKYWDGTTEYLLGIDESTVQLGVADGGAGALTGTYQYIMTYYNSTKGIESQSTPISLELTVVSKDIDLTFLEASTDPQVDQKRIYRVGGDLTAFALVDTIANATTSYTDSIADVDIPGDDFVSALNGQALSGLKYLTEAHGILFGAFEDKLYFSKIGEFTSWPATYFIDIPTDVTGIAAIGIGILVFTKYRTHIVTGTSRLSFSRRIFSADQGCLTFDSIQNVKGTLIWVSSDGICTVAGSLVEVISKNKLGTIALDIQSSVFQDEVYYGLRTDDTIIAYDFRFGPIIKELDLDVTALIVGEDKIYGYNSGKYYELFKGTHQLPFHYFSPKMVDGSTTLRKIYKSVLIDSIGELELEVYIDDILVVAKTIRDDDVNEVKIPEASKNGYGIQFHLTGPGEVFGLDYTVAGVTK